MNFTERLSATAWLYRLLSVIAVFGLVTQASFTFAQSEEPEPDKYQIELASRTFTPPAGIREGLSAVNASGKPTLHVLLQFYDRRTFAQEYHLKEIGVLLLNALSDVTYLASVPGSLSSDQPALKPVRWIGFLLPEDKIDVRVLADGVGEWAQNDDGTVRLRVSFFGDVSDEAALQFLKEQGAEASVVYSIPTLGPEFEISVWPDALLGLAEADIVRWIVDGDPEPVIANDGSRAWTKTDPVHVLGFKGEGINLGIWDEGWVDGHPAFGGRVTVIDRREVKPNAHATHVAGTMAADVAGLSGHAPKAPNIFSFDFKASPFNPSDWELPWWLEWPLGFFEISATLEMLLARIDPAKNIDVANNSWGFRTGWGQSPSGKDGFHFPAFGAYTVRSEDLDGVVGSTGLIIPFAAHNFRQGAPASGKLLTRVLNTDATVHVQIPVKAPPFGFVLIDEEIIWYGDIDRNNQMLLQCQRGMGDTVVESHAQQEFWGEEKLVLWDRIPRGPGDPVRAQANKDRLGVPGGLLGANRRFVTPGYFTLSPEAAAKNVITVGAIVDGHGGQPGGDRMTALSGWGPTLDGRIKPDLVAPGYDIKSTVPGGGYDRKTGTSMATAAVSGIAALVKQAYKTTFAGKAPFPSTVKVAMICTAEDLTLDSYANKDSAKFIGPDYRYGWGKVNAEAAVNKVQNKDLHQGKIDAGKTDFFWFFVPPGGAPLNISLAWDDPQAAGATDTTPPNDKAGLDPKALKHDLDLKLVGPGGVPHHPWLLDPEKPALAAGKGADHRNNVEQVVVDQPAWGLWTATVTAAGLPATLKQKYSICVPGPTLAFRSETLWFKLIGFHNGVTTDGIVNVSHLSTPPDFELPFEKNVRILISVEDPNDPENDLEVFDQTIAAGTVASGSTRYRYDARGSGINQLIFEKLTDATTYMYLDVQEIDLLPDERLAMSQEEYIDFLRRINKAYIQVYLDDQVWESEAALVPGLFTEHKQWLILAGQPEEPPMPGGATVTYPTDLGIEWLRGGTYAINWSGFSAPVKIQLFKGFQFQRNIVSWTENDGVYTWTVPTSQPLGSDYRIKIISTQNAAESDLSDNMFRITEPKPVVTYPSGAGITWPRGQSQTITWTGFTGKSVKIQLYKGSSYVTRIADATSNSTGAFQWTVPTWLKPGSDYRVKIISTSKSSQADFSDNSFTIQ